MMKHCDLDCPSLNYNSVEPWPCKDCLKHLVECDNSCGVIRMTFFDDVRDWHKKMELRHNTDVLYDELEVIWTQRIRLITEELAELSKAVSEEDWKEIADALADLTFVVLGTAVEFNLPFNEIWNEVRRSNLSKVGGYLDKGGKFVKPDSYSPPNLDKIMHIHHWQQSITNRSVNFCSGCNDIQVR